MRCLLLLLLCVSGQFLRGQEGATYWNRHTIDAHGAGADGTKVADVNHDGKIDIVCGWEESGIVRLYLNNGEKEDWPYVELIAPNVEDALPFDVNDDGFMDVVSCSEGSYMSVRFHIAPSNWDAYPDAKQWTSFDVPSTKGLTRWMFAIAMDVDGKYGKDLFLGSKDPDGMIAWLEAPEDPHNVANWKLHKLTPAGWIMSLISIDMNDDGHKDILFTDRKGAHRGVRWLEHPVNMDEKPWKNHLIGMEQHEPMFMGVNAQTQEIWVPNLDDYLFQFSLEHSIWKKDSIPFPPNSGNRGKSIALGDIDHDGFQDIISTYEGSQGKIGVYRSSFSNQSWKHQAISDSLGIKYDLSVLIDMDGDGDLDILTSEEREKNPPFNYGLGVFWYENPLGKE